VKKLAVEAGSGILATTMGKRLTCTRCGAENEYDVPTQEAAATLREVRCRACGKRFAYGFRPEYVTESEPQLRESRSSDASYDSATETVAARERLTQHVMRHTEYHDRDRDVLLLHLLDMADHLDHEQSSIKRALDVLIKRSSK
jgi:DNA-directed RNA polymerase subunit RPC12/RpoP